MYIFGPLRKWCRWSYLPSRNRDTKIEEKHLDARGWGRMNWEIGINMHMLMMPCIK